MPEALADVNTGATGAIAAHLRSFVDEVIERHQGDVVAMVTHNVLCQIATCLLLNTPVNRSSPYATTPPTSASSAGVPVRSARTG